LEILRSDIAEGLNAGMWTIGVTRTGKYGWSLLKLIGKALDPYLSGTADFRRLLNPSNMFGAHYVIDTVADSLPALEEIAMRLKHGDSSVTPAVVVTAKRR